MPKLNSYLDEETMQMVREGSREEGLSMSRHVVNAIMDRLEDANDCPLEYRPLPQEHRGYYYAREAGLTFNGTPVNTGIDWFDKPASRGGFHAPDLAICR